MASCAEWTGIKLSTLLDEAGVDPKAKWFIAEGADAPHLTRSVPLKKARDDALIALYQNGERLMPANGYPLRLLELEKALPKARAERRTSVIGPHSGVICWCANAPCGFAPPTSRSASRWSAVIGGSGAQALRGHDADPGSRPNPPGEAVRGRSSSSTALDPEPTAQTDPERSLVPSHSFGRCCPTADLAQMERARKGGGRGAGGAEHHSFTGVRMGAPLPFSSTTTNLAGSVLLALRPTT
jgi:hypothetical protein